MSERRKGGWWRCGWWRYPGAPVRVVLAFTAAGLVVSALLLALTCFLPNGPPNGAPNGEDSSIGSPPVSAPPLPDGGDPLKDMAKALKGIEKSLSGARDLSITVKLDKDQWKEIKTELREAAGLRGCGDGLTCKVDRIAGGVEKIAGNTGRIATGVEKISNETGTVARGVKDIAMGMKNVSVEAGAIAAGVEKIAGNTGRIATEVEKITKETSSVSAGVKDIPTDMKNVLDKVDAIAAGVKDIADGMGGGIVVIGGLGGMTRPWACREEPDKCLGAVHFPHDWPERGSIYADGECGKWEGSGNEEPIPEPICRELKEIVYKLPSPPPPEVWVVGHASTLGTELHNDDLSKRRTKFVVDRLEEEWGDKWGNNVHFKTCAIGERGSADSLRHPDAWYRVVQVFAQKPQALTENPAWWWCSE